MSFSLYFRICCILQLACLGANLLAHSILAALQARAGTKPGEPKRRRHILAAAARGVLNLELAYHEFFKQKAVETASSREAMQRHTTAALYYKLVELVFEAPQVLLSWTALLLRIIAEYMLSKDQQPGRPAGSTVALPGWLWVGQILKAGLGLVFLSIAAMEFMRLHPRSSWASSKPPPKLLFGIIDVSESGRRSLVMGLYAFCSILNRSILFMFTITGNITLILSGYTRQMQNTGHLESWVSGGLAQVLPFIIWPSACFIFNALLLLGMRSWSTVVAAVISMFINIPWATGSTLHFRISRWSSWPSWVMQFAYFGLSIVFIAIGSMVVDPAQVAEAACNSSGGEESYPFSSNLSFILPVTIIPFFFCLSEMGLFLGMAGWQSNRRRRYLKQHGSTEHMAEELGIAVEPPACVYKLSGNFMVLVDEQQESKDPL
jgi:hypothetical protein